MLLPQVPVRIRRAGALKTLDRFRDEGHKLRISRGRSGGWSKCWSWSALWDAALAHPSVSVLLLTSACLLALRL